MMREDNRYNKTDDVIDRSITLSFVEGRSLSSSLQRKLTIFSLFSHSVFYLGPISFIKAFAIHKVLQYSSMSHSCITLERIVRKGELSDRLPPDDSIVFSFSFMSLGLLLFRVQHLPVSHPE